VTATKIGGIDMSNQSRLVTFLLVLPLQALSLAAQVITPMELQDPKLQHLQQRHLQTLMTIGRAIENTKFPYPFYLCRTLDVDVAKIQAADQRSIRFDLFQRTTVLAITGNYYASYSANRMNAEERLKETFQRVIAPILEVEVPHFPDDSEFSAFAIEVSHHVRRKVMGMTSEVPENMTVVIPVVAAQRYVDAKTEDQKEEAILDAEIFLNGEPYSLWLREGAPPENWNERNPAKSSSHSQIAATASAPSSDPANGSRGVSSSILKPVTARIISPDVLERLQRQNQDSIDRMEKALDPVAHFVSYVPPSFVAFRQGSYLQLAASTTLKADPTSSRYKLAALAFDEHISHLVRPLLTYFPVEVDFDGVDFSATIHISDTSKIEAVEFFLPYRSMQCFASYDCTGQQLLDAGVVIINGERAALDLQIAEGRN
jgi:hypothetical protein